jgi:hypothetical protein
MRAQSVSGVSESFTRHSRLDRLGVRPPAGPATCGRAGLDRPRAVPRDGSRPEAMQDRYQKTNQNKALCDLGTDRRGFNGDPDARPSVARMELRRGNGACRPRAHDHAQTWDRARLCRVSLQFLLSERLDMQRGIPQPIGKTPSFGHGSDWHGDCYSWIRQPPLSDSLQPWGHPCTR